MSDKPNIVVVPPVAALLSLILSAALGFVFSLHIFPPFPSMFGILIGLALSGAGFWLAFAAAGQFRSNDTEIDPRKAATTIVTNGPYRFTRNPMYVGLLIVHFGVGLVFSLDWAAVATPVLWAVLHWGVVLREEEYLLDKFGNDYKDLLVKTRRWL